MRAPDQSSPVDFTLHTPNPSHVDARLADLLLTAATFRSIAADCDEHVGTIAGIEWNLPLRGDVLSPVTSLTCTSGIIGLTVGPGSLTETSAQATVMAALLDFSVGAYESAESTAGQLVDSVTMPVDAAMTAAALAKVATSALAGGKVDATIIRRVAPDAIELTVQTLSDALPGSYATDLATMEAITASIAGPPRKVRTTMTAGPGDAGGRPEVRSVSEAAHQIPNLYKNAKNAGHTQIQRVVDPKTGKGAWTVVLPGTSSFAPNAKNPFNGHGNLIAASGNKSPAEEAVFASLRQAMAKEGVAGKGEPVMVIGHSQGGMVATNMARHAGSEFNISHVVTYGSPVGHLKVPHQTSVLNVENTDDQVHRTDGHATGDGEPNRVRAEFTDPGSLTGPDGKPSLVEAHSMERYADNYQSMTEVDRSNPNSQLTQFERSTDAFFRGEARSYDFDLTSVDEPEKPQEPSADVPLGLRPGLSVK